MRDTTHVRDWQEKHAHKRLPPIPDPHMSASTQFWSRTCSLRIGRRLLASHPGIIAVEPALPKGELDQHAALRAWQRCSQSSWMRTSPGYKHLQRAMQMQLLTCRSCGASSRSTSAASHSRTCHWSGKHEDDPTHQTLLVCCACGSSVLIEMAQCGLSCRYTLWPSGTMADKYSLISRTCLTSS